MTSQPLINVSIIRDRQILAVDASSPLPHEALMTWRDQPPSPPPAGGIKRGSPATSVSSPLGRQGIRLRSLCRSPRLSLPPLLLRSRLKRLQTFPDPCEVL
uniref:Uncharacterized protein n=1 Tax=Oryza glumipatula TaxID=40148 RepID=A0A0E0BD80_9ORYZ